MRRFFARAPAGALRPLVLALALLVPACSRELFDTDSFASDSLAQPDLSGSVRIPLTTTADDGTTYLLRDATLEISGSAMMTLSSPDAELSATAATKQPAQPGLEALIVPLPAGSYTLYLRPGYKLIEIAPSGEQRPVQAELASINPANFLLRELQDATLKLSFQHEGRHVVFGAPQTVRVTRAF